MEQAMQIQINTDHNIAGHEALATHVRSVVEGAMSHMGDHITRVEVHLTDDIGQGSEKSGKDDKRCVMEARLERHQPIVVTCHAGSLHQAVDGAAHKLTRTVEHTVGKMRDKKRRAPAPDLTPEAPVPEE
jgi:ribosome-associated translation inhibitor RaiA